MSKRAVLCTCACWLAIMQLLEVNSGGAVFFLFFQLTKQQQQQQRQLRRQLQHQNCEVLGSQAVQQQQPSNSSSSHRLYDRYVTCREGVAVLKVGSSRLAMQAEQFANELTRHLGIAAPDCRIVRQVRHATATFQFDIMSNTLWVGQYATYQVLLPSTTRAFTLQHAHCCSFLMEVYDCTMVRGVNSCMLSSSA